MAYIAGVNRIRDLINGVSRDMENKILLVVSVLFSALLGSFLTARRYLLSILTLGILLLCLLIALIKEINDKKNLQNQMRILIKKTKEETGLDLRQ